MTPEETESYITEITVALVSVMTAVARTRAALYWFQTNDAEQIRATRKRLDEAMDAAFARVDKLLGRLEVKEGND